MQSFRVLPTSMLTGHGQNSIETGSQQVAGGSRGLDQHNVLKNPVAPSIVVDLMPSNYTGRSSQQESMDQKTSTQKSELENNVNKGKILFNKNIL